MKTPKTKVTKSVALLLSVAILLSYGVPVFGQVENSFEPESSKIEVVEKVEAAESPFEVSTANTDELPTIESSNTETQISTSDIDDNNDVSIRNPDVCRVNIYSDTYNKLQDGNYAVPTYNPGSRWSANIHGATWIWKSYFVATPEQDEYATFERQFKLSNDIYSASLMVAADNSYEVYVNGNLAGADATENNYFEEGKDTYDVARFLVLGTNKISFNVKNWALIESTPEFNPAGLLFKLEVIGRETCPSNNPPYVNLIGSNPVTIFVGDSFYDPGATADDEEDGDLTLKIEKTTSVDASVVGDYTIRYSVTDSNGSSAFTERMVRVIDNIDKCALPQNMGSTNHEFIGVSYGGEEGVNSILSRMGYVFDPINDQKNYQSWNLLKASTTVEVEFIGSITGAANVFGYYTLNNPSGFTPIIKGNNLVNVSYPNTPEGVLGNKYYFNVNSTDIQFAINASAENVNLSSLWSSVNSINLDNTDHMIAYVSSINQNLQSNSYVLAFEDLPGVLNSDRDFNDLIVKITFMDCGDLDPEKPDNPKPNDDNSGGGGSGGGGISGRRRDVSSLMSTSTSFIQAGTGLIQCTYLNDYLGRDTANDPKEMMKLQLFLNSFEKENLPLSGIFDDQTFQAVVRFQNKHSADILAPWGYDTPTGFVYILTKKKINEIYCNSVLTLTPNQQSEVETFRTYLQNIKDSEGEIPNIENTIGQNEPSFISLLAVKSEENSNEATSTIVQGETIVKDNGILSNNILRNAAVSIFAIPGDWSGITKIIGIFLVQLVAVYSLSSFIVGGVVIEEDRVKTRRKKIILSAIGLIVVSIIAYFLSYPYLVVPSFVLALLFVLAVFILGSGKSEETKPVMEEVAPTDFSNEKPIVSYDKSLEELVVTEKNSEKIDQSLPVDEKGPTTVADSGRGFRGLLDPK